jgi:hypothetical protein
MRSALRPISLLLLLAACLAVSRASALTPGPTIVRECPSCTNQVSQFTIGSGNTMGATWWTDGKMEAPMLPFMPALVKCPHCKHLLWLEDAKKLGQLNLWSSTNAWPKARDVVKPDEQDYLAAAKVPKLNRQRELYARQQAWWLANDPLRRKSGASVTWSGARAENLDRLFVLFNEADECELQQKAEIARERGQFEQCLKLLTREFSTTHRTEAAGLLRRLAGEKNSQVQALP